jgi:hypothetical protein
MDNAVIMQISAKFNRIDDTGTRNSSSIWKPDVELLAYQYIRPVKVRNYALKLQFLGRQYVDANKKDNRWSFVSQKCCNE